ncbi:MAG: hypothetical protein ACK50Q_13010 [Labrys sp. (in: a-proteobacteria)]|jgi:hypothetical protein
MSGFVTKSLIAAAALAAGIVAAPLAASAGGYGYGYGYGGGYANGGGHYETYVPVHYKRCFYKKVRYYDEYYGHYRVKRVRVCR